MSFSFSHMLSGDQTEVIKLGGQALPAKLPHRSLKGYFLKWKEEEEEDDDDNEDILKIKELIPST